MTLLKTLETTFMRVDLHFFQGHTLFHPSWTLRREGQYPKTPKPLIFHVSVVNNWLTIQINTYFIGEITI